MSKRPHEDSDSEGVEWPPLPIFPSARGVKPAYRTHRSPKKQAFASLVGSEILVKRNENYHYDTLGPNEIRVLEIQPGSEDEKIRCALITVEFPRKKHHESTLVALSYVWGNDNLSEEIEVFFKVPDSKTYQRTIYSDFGPINQQDKEPATGNKVAKSRIPRLDRDKILRAKSLNPQKFFVGKNLFEALKRLRERHSMSWIWVDAICINQNSVKEKTEQLGKIHDIYNKAGYVCIWLGEADKEGSSDRAMAFVNEVINANSLKSLVSKEASIEGWHSLADLMSSQWFSRRWVVQEVALARKATVLCGDKSVDWRDFADAVAIFEKKLDEVKALYRRANKPGYYAKDLSFIEASGAATMISTIENLFLKSKDGEVMQRNVTLETLVSTLLTFDAKNPRDIIYALLSIAKDSPLADICSRPPSKASRDLLQPDYKKDALEVYKNFVHHCVESSGSLDIICRYWALPLTREGAKLTTKSKEQVENYRTLPSWIGLITDSPFGSPNRLEDRVNANSLVGIPKESRYNASDGVDAIVRFVDNRSTPDMSHEQTTKEIQIGHGPPVAVVPATYEVTLFAKGIILGEITVLSDRMLKSTIPYEALEMGGWEVRSGQGSPSQVPDQLWRTLVADRDPDGKNPPGWYHRVCLECLAQTDEKGHLDPKEIINDERTSDLVVEFLRRVQSVVWNRKMMQAKPSASGEEQLFGLAPEKAKVGDLVCVLLGCSVPVILRPSVRESEAQAHYEFVGESYVHGKMNGIIDGQPLSYLCKKELERYPEFELR